MTVSDLTQATFERSIVQSNTPALIDFYADWCGPCRMMAPIFESVSSDFDGRVNFLKLNTQQEPDLSDRFGIQGIPTLILVHQGKIVDRFVGLMQPQALKAKIDAALARL